MGRKSLKLKDSWSGVGLAGSAGLLVVASCVLAAPVMTNTDAAEFPPISAGVNTDTAVFVRSTIAVSVTDKALIDVTPLSKGAFAESGEATLTVATNNTAGYEVYLTTSDGSGKLFQQTGSSDPATIQPVDGVMTAENFKNHLDSWGYNISSAATGAEMATNAGEFKAIPDNGGGAIARTDKLTANDVYDLKFGAAISANVPAGIYSNTVVVSAVANPVEVRSLSDIMTMQEVTQKICTNTREEYTTQLTDTRDGKKYWVAKLKDGRCWMTQNLAFDIKVNDDGTSNVRAADSDVASDWNTVPAGEGWTKATLSGDDDKIFAGTTYDYYTRDGENYYPPLATNMELNRGLKMLYPGNPVVTYSWDLGESVIADPLFAHRCNGVIVPASCENVKDVADWAPTHTASTSSSIDEATQTYDAHYLVGNYYVFNAATAGTGGDLASGEAPNSICPKGWKLPAAGHKEKTAGSYMYLISQYGFTPTGNMPNASGYDLRLAPFYFNESGFIFLFPNEGSTLQRVSQMGTYASTSVTNQNSIYGLNLEGDIYSYSNTLDTLKNMARSVRCVNSAEI